MPKFSVTLNNALDYRLKVYLANGLTEWTMVSFKG